MAELVAYSKTVKGKMNYASAGVGSVSHLNFEVFKDAVGMEAIYIPYKGGGQAIADVVAGHVPMTITSVQATKSLVESGKLKAFAVTSLTRSPAMPHVPTMQEAGVKKTADVELRFWFGIFGPKGMPDAVKAKLEGVFKQVLADQRLRERLANLDITPDFAPGPALRARLETKSGAGRNSSTRRASSRNKRGATPTQPELLNNVKFDLGDTLVQPCRAIAAAACETSMTRPLTNGPRSFTRTVTDRPVVTLVTRTFVPNGSVG